MADDKTTLLEAQALLGRALRANGWCVTTEADNNGTHLRVWAPQGVDRRDACADATGLVPKLKEA